MEGRLVDANMRPVPDTRVERTWDWGWNSKKGTQTTTTDAEGRFEFPTVIGRSLTAGILVHQPQITQRVKAQGPDGAVTLFAVDKNDYRDNSERNGKPLRVVCRIDMKPGISAGDFWGTVVELP